MPIKRLAKAANRRQGVPTAPDGPRVLHVIASLRIGGTETQLVQFIRRSTSPRNHFVAVFDEPGELAGELPRPPIELGPLRRNVLDLPRSLRTALRLRKAVRDHSIDLVHAHLGISEVLATIVPRGIPVVASRRGLNIGFAQGGPFFRLLEGIGHRRTKILLCNSRYLARQAADNDLWAPPTYVIHNAVDLSHFMPVPQPEMDVPTVAVVANLKTYKGQERFLRAFARVTMAVPNAKALLVGDGPAREEFKALARELGIASSVTFVGQVSDPRPYVSQSHLVCLTSTHEGFPNALLEAMAMSRPVVATRVGGTPELVRDGVDGMLTTMEPEDISAAILTILSDSALRSRMAAAARRRAEAFRWDRVVQETEGVYQRVLQERLGRSRAAHRNRHR